VKAAIAQRIQTATLFPASGSNDLFLLIKIDRLLLEKHRDRTVTSMHVVRNDFPGRVR